MIQFWIYDLMLVLKENVTICVKPWNVSFPFSPQQLHFEMFQLLFQLKRESDFHSLDTKKNTFSLLQRFPTFLCSRTAPPGPRSPLPTPLHIKIKTCILPESVNIFQFPIRLEFHVPVEISHLPLGYVGNRWPIYNLSDCFGFEILSNERSKQFPSQKYTFWKINP